MFTTRRARRFLLTVRVVVRGVSFEPRKNSQSSTERPLHSEYIHVVAELSCSVLSRTTTGMQEISSHDCNRVGQKENVHSRDRSLSSHFFYFKRPKVLLARHNPKVPRVASSTQQISPHQALGPPSQYIWINRDTKVHVKLLANATRWQYNHTPASRGNTGGSYRTLTDDTKVETIVDSRAYRCAPLLASP